ncbi:VDE lipocalin domain-containing protein [Aureococcus anophagefferens]|nr:VDE lipocalin domain-containing protein [Aureococcus anophagefferens]
MFGLTFWENWSVIGENAKDEPEFKFIHYSGKASQNTSRAPSSVASRAPRGQKSVYRIAKEAGMVPANFCAVRNDLATCGADAAADGAPVPEALARKGLFTRAAFASEVDETGLASDRKPDPVLPKWVRTVGEGASYLEDPTRPARVFAQQQKMGPGDDDRDV